MSRLTSKKVTAIVDSPPDIERLKTLKEACKFTMSDVEGVIAMYRTEQ